MSVMISSIPPRINNNISFKGYDARPLQGFIISEDYAGMGSELKEIGEKEDFKVVIHNSGTYWLQDYLHFVKDTVCSFDPFYLNETSKVMFLKPNETQKKLQDRFPIAKWLEKIRVLDNSEDVDSEHFSIMTPKGKKVITEKEYLAQKEAISDKIANIHVAGGNFFLVKGKDGEDELLIGSNSSQKIAKKNLKEMFGVKKIVEVPQADFHLDLFIRPLNNQKILIADDKKTLQVIELGMSKAKKLLDSPKSKLTPKQISELKDIYSNLADLKEIFQVQISNNEWEPTRKVEQVLKEAGYEVIKVPGRIYYNNMSDKYKDKACNHYVVNYMNANVLENKQGDIVYITNKSQLDVENGLTPQWQEKLDFGFEREFTKSLLPYVKKEHIHYVGGYNAELTSELLYYCNGGLHCMSVEVPYFTRLKEHKD